MRGLLGREKREAGGAEGIRTPDLRVANATLSQLSYGPHKPAFTIRSSRIVGTI